MLAVDLQNLTKRYGTVTAVAQLTLQIEPGEIVAFLGPNGAGKTTTIDMLLGLARPDQGTVRVYGNPPGDAVGRGEVAAVMQSGGLLKDFTVGETVDYTASLYAHAVGPTTVSDSTRTRIASKRSSWSMVPAGARSEGDKSNGVGNGCPVFTSLTVGLMIWVRGSVAESPAGLHSETTPLTTTALPMATPVGNPDGVATKMASEVFGSLSVSASGAWRKKPSLMIPVTRFVVVVTTWPRSGCELCICTPFPLEGMQIIFTCLLCNI